MKWLRSKLETWGTTGIKIPLAYDGTKPPSARLLFMYVAFWLMICSAVLLHFRDVSAATWTTMGIYALCSVFYLFKEINKFKISRGEIEVEDTEESSGEKN